LRAEKNRIYSLSSLFPFSRSSVLSLSSLSSLLHLGISLCSSKFNQHPANMTQEAEQLYVPACKLEEYSNYRIDETKESDLVTVQTSKLCGKSLQHCYEGNTSDGVWHDSHRMESSYRSLVSNEVRYVWITLKTGKIQQTRKRVKTEV